MEHHQPSRQPPGDTPIGLGQLMRGRHKFRVTPGAGHLLHHLLDTHQERLPERLGVVHEHVGPEGPRDGHHRCHLQGVAKRVGPA